MYFALIIRIVKQFAGFPVVLSSTKLGISGEKYFFYFSNRIYFFGICSSNLGFVEDLSELSSTQGAAISQFAFLDRAEVLAILNGNQVIERVAGNIGISKRGSL